MSRRGPAALALAAILGVLGHDDAWAHAGLRLSDPIAGATLGDTPTTVLLTFREKPEAALSAIRVLDTAGAAYQLGPPTPVTGSPLSLAVRVRPLERGVYTVSFRVVSAVDGHAIEGAYAFGVRVAPTGSALVATNPAVSAFEMIARLLFITGLVILLGASSAAVARFGGDADCPLGASGWCLSALGLVLLACAQKRTAGASFAVFLSTSIGRALIWRAVAIGAAGGALLAASWARPPIRRSAMAAAALAAAAAIAAHVAAGHAAAARWLPGASVAVQWAHFTAAGVWLGGLAALLLGVRGLPSAAKADAARRFSTIAAASLLAVAATGLARALEEIPSWADLITTGYGRAVSAKIALVAGVAALGALNRWRGVPAATTNLRPLRRAGGGELALTAGLLAASAALGTLPTPAALRQAEPPVLDVSGVDFGTTVRVRLTTGSDQAGPNRFVVMAVDYDTKTPVPARRISLRFTPLDDPGVAPTTLALASGPDHSWVGSGANLAFDGRWLVTALIERAGDSVEIPLEVEVASLPPFISVERLKGRPPYYTFTTAYREFVRFSPDPERAGPSRMYVTFFDVIGDERPIQDVVVTAAAGKSPTRQLPVRRLNPGRFVADVELEPGRNRIAAVARIADGTRLRAAIDLEIPGR